MIDLKSEREAKEMTQQELADRCGVIRQTIAEYESGRIKPSVPVAIKLGEVLDFEWSKIFTD